LIDCGHFHLACPPFTGSTWCIKALAAAGLGDASKTGLHLPHISHWGQECPPLKVSTVRHPAMWLRSYWLNRGHIGVPLVDRFLPWAKESEDFSGFVRTYLKEDPGAIGNMFFSYNANNWIRTDELVPAFREMLELVGCPEKQARLVESVEPQNVFKGKKPAYPPHLFDLVLEAERDLCSYFEF